MIRIFGDTEKQEEDLARDNQVEQRKQHRVKETERKSFHICFFKESVEQCWSELSFFITVSRATASQSLQVNKKSSMLFSSISFKLSPLTSPLSAGKSTCLRHSGIKNDFNYYIWLPFVLRKAFYLLTYKQFVEKTSTQIRFILLLHNCCCGLLLSCNENVA